MTPKTPSSIILRKVGALSWSNFEVSYAGECPWNQGYCFGSDDGRLLFLNSGMTEGPEPDQVAESGEAINGVAFSGDMCAVSTRAEVAFYKVPAPSGHGVGRIVYRVGAHGIIALPSGGFAASLGPGGLLLMEPTSNHQMSMRFFEQGKSFINFYKIAALSDASGSNVLICAARKDGYLALSVPRGQSPTGLRLLKGPGIDIVSVCGLGIGERPLAMAALGRDHSIHLMSDLFSDRAPISLRPPDLRGTAYTILAAQGHLFVLSSRALYTFPNLAARFLDGDHIGGIVTVYGMDVEAVDAYLAYNDRVLIVLPDKVLSLEIEELVSGGSGESRRPNLSESPNFNTTWEPTGTFDPTGPSQLFEWDEAPDVELIFV